MLSAGRASLQTQSYHFNPQVLDSSFNNCFNLHLSGCVHDAGCISVSCSETSTLHSSTNRPSNVTQHHTTAPTVQTHECNQTFISSCFRFAYKDEYEKFKLYLTVILLLFSFTCRFLLSYRFHDSFDSLNETLFCIKSVKEQHTRYVFFLHRVLDALFNFLLVWYYCTLTIRESILINNGSK